MERHGFHMTDTSKLIVSVLGLLIFLSGGVVGWSTLYVIHKKDMGPPPPGPPKIRDIPKMFEKYDLTPEQRTALQQFHDEHGEKMTQAWKQCEAIIDPLRQSYKQRIKQILTPRQFKEWEEDLKRLMKFRRRGRPGRQDHWDRRGPRNPNDPNRRGSPPPWIQHFDPNDPNRPEPIPDDWQRPPRQGRRGQRPPGPDMNPEE